MRKGKEDQDMGRAVISGWVPKVKAVPLQHSSVKPSNDAGASEEVELPPYGVCCVCLRRIEDVKIGRAHV